MSDDEGKKPKARKIKTTQSSGALTTSKKASLSPRTDDQAPAEGKASAAAPSKVRRLETVATLTPQAAESAPKKKTKKASADAEAAPVEKIQPLDKSVAAKVDAQVLEDEEPDYTLAYNESENSAPLPRKRRRKLRTVGEASRLPKMMVTITTADGTTKKLFATGDFLVREFVNVVVEKLEIWQSEFFSVVRIDDHSKVPYLLDPDATLADCGVVDQAQLYLRVKYWKMPFRWADPVAVRQFYAELSQTIIKDEFPVPVKVAMRLAGLQMLITYGPFVRAKHKPGFLTREILEQFVPADLIRSTPGDYLETRIFFYYRQYGDMDKQKAAEEYVMLSRQIPAWGVHFFDGSLEGVTPLRLGLVEDGFLIPDDPAHPRKMTFHSFATCKTEAAGNILTLKLPSRRLNFKTETALVNIIFQLVQGYMWILCRQKTPGFEPENVSEPHAPTDVPHYVYLRRPVDRDAQAKDLDPPKKESLLARLKDIYTSKCETEHVKPVNRFMLQIETQYELGKIGDLVDLRRCNLDDESLDLIVNAIGTLLQDRDKAKEKGVRYKNDFHPSALLVGHNALQDGHHFSKLARFIALKTLDATDNKLGDDAARKMSSSLKTNQELEELTLEGNLIHTQGLAYLLDALSGSPNLKLLNLASNKLDKDSAGYLADFLKTVPQLSSLNVADNKLGEAGSTMLMEALAAVKDSLTSLNVTNIKMGPKAMSLLRTFLSKPNRISSLRVGYNVFNSAMGAVVVDLIKAPQANIKELDLSYTQLAGSSLNHTLEALLANKTIERLVLTGLVPDKKGIPFIGKLLSTNASLQCLVLRNCNLEKGAMVEIAKGLESNKTLKELDLAGNRLESREALEAWQDALAANSSLSILNLAACNMEGHSIGALAPGVQENKGLERLHLDGNKFDRDLAWMVAMLPGNKKLKILTVQNTGVTIKDLAVALTKISKLSALDTLDVSRNAEFSKSSPQLTEFLARYNYITIRVR